MVVLAGGGVFGDNSCTDRMLCVCVCVCVKKRERYIVVVCVCMSGYVYGCVIGVCVHTQK